jgi:hypothetical protein
MPGKGLQDRGRYRQRVVEERAQITYRGQLQGKAQAVMSAAAGHDLRPIVVGEMEEPGEFVRCRRIGVAAVVLALDGRKEMDRHRYLGRMEGVAKLLSSATPAAKPKKCRKYKEFA